MCIDYFSLDYILLLCNNSDFNTEIKQIFYVYMTISKLWNDEWFSR
jgi:hypothetical protein